MFSLELPKNTIRVERFACYSVRNVALASHTVVEDAGVDHYGNMHHAFSRCLDLIHIFGTVKAIVNALKIRFDELPIHSNVYYNSYYDSQMTLEDIRNASTIGSERNPTGLQQDCIGMTPLHILACSTVQCLELYHSLLRNTLKI
jgi:hypothetical protein